ncbi:MAG: hypothetical protein P8Y20_00910, partial [Gammaproteobacteria bacterium]
MLQNLVVMMPVIPLLMAVITYVYSKQLQRHVARLSVLSILITFLVSLVLLYSAISDNHVLTVSFGQNWGTLLY